MIVVKLQLVYCLWLGALIIAMTRKDATWAMCWPVALVMSGLVICCGGPA